MLRILNVVGTRPNLVKMAAVLRAQRARPKAIEPLLLHTGQHRDDDMSGRFFAEFDLPAPDVTLQCAGGSQAEQIGRLLTQLPPLFADLRPDRVLVVGDVNSSAAAALAAATQRLPIAHVEAGLRSFDRRMPEELNRIVVDAVSDLLFASEPSAVANLTREGHAADRIHHVGNVMIDTLVHLRSRAAADRAADAMGLAGRYAVLTLHRPSNVDDSAVLGPLLQALGEVSRRLPIVFPVHPRTRQQMDRAGLAAMLGQFPGLRATPPIGYLEMLGLMAGAAMVLTDSGGIQEETTYLGVPCLTLRETTERPATVDEGTNRVIGTAPQRVVNEIDRLLNGDRPPRRCPALWDGKAAERVVDCLLSSG